MMKCIACDKKFKPKKEKLTFRIKCELGVIEVEGVGFKCPACKTEYSGEEDARALFQDFDDKYEELQGKKSQDEDARLFERILKRWRAYSSRQLKLGEKTSVIQFAMRERRLARKDQDQKWAEKLNDEMKKCARAAAEVAIEETEKDRQRIRQEERNWWHKKICQKCYRRLVVEPNAKEEIKTKKDVKNDG